MQVGFVETEPRFFGRTGRCCLLVKPRFVFLILGYLLEMTKLKFFFTQRLHRALHVSVWGYKITLLVMVYLEGAENIISNKY